MRGQAISIGRLLRRGLRTAPLPLCGRNKWPLRPSAPNCGLCWQQRACCRLGPPLDCATLLAILCDAVQFRCMPRAYCNGCRFHWHHVTRAVDCAGVTGGFYEVSVGWCVAGCGGPGHGRSRGRSVRRRRAGVFSPFSPTLCCWLFIYRSPLQVGGNRGARLAALRNVTGWDGRVNTSSNRGGDLGSVSTRQPPSRPTITLRRLLCLPDRNAGRARTLGGGAEVQSLQR